MNHDHQDQILDAFLQEVICGRTPPDLSARILAELAAGNRNGQASAAPIPPPIADPPIARTVSLASLPADQDWVASGNVASPTRSARLARNQRDRRSNRATRVGYVSAAAALLVAMGLGVAAWRHSVRDVPGTDDSQLATHPNPQSNSTASQDGPGRSHRVIRPGTGAPNSDLDTSPPPTLARDLATENANAFDKTLVPFGHGNSVASDNAVPKHVTPRAEPLTDSEVVAAIDQLVRKAWDDFGTHPSEYATDAEWCRRAYLRLAGRIPTVNELQAYVDSRGSSKREELIEQLVSSHEFSENWATILTNMLLGRTGGTEDGSYATREGLRQYLEKSLAEAKPYDQLVFELVSAEGSNSPSADDYNGAVNYLLSVYDAQATLATSRTCQAFLGQQIRCVQCHDHPTNDGWRQHDFWALNSFFRQMRVERDAKSGDARLVDVDFKGEGTGDLAEAEVYYEDLTGYKRAAYPRLPDGSEVSKSGSINEVDRRRELARWIASSDDMGRALVNRFWDQFFGYGFTKPVDDMGAHNPPSNPELIERLSKQFAAHNYDVRSLARWIAASEPFRLSSKTRADQQADVPETGGIALFSRYYTRQMEPEEVYKSLLIAARTPGQQGSAATQARQEWMGQFARNMGTDEGDEIIAFDRDIHESLVMMNGPLMRQATSTSEGSLLRRVIDSPMSPAEKVEHLFLASVARKPTKRELDVSLRMIQSRENAATALQDIWWALLNSSEFILDH